MGQSACWRSDGPRCHLRSDLPEATDFVPAFPTAVGAGWCILSHFGRIDLHV